MNLSPGKRRAVVAAAVFLVVFGVTGFFVLPPIVRAQAEKRLSAELGRPVTVEKVRMNPFALSLTVEGLDIKEKDGRGSFLGWSRLYVRFDALASLTGDWVLGDIELDGFHAGVVVNPDGSFNFSDLLAKFSAPSPGPSKPGRPIRIGLLGVSKARIDFSDRSLRHPFATQVGPLTFALTGFRTAGARGAPGHFEAVTDSGERIVWNGTLSADPVASRGDFHFENIVLKKYAPYIERLTPADVTDGKLTVRGSYVADFDPKNRIMSLGSTEVHLRELKVSERSTGKSAAELDMLVVTGLQADAIALKASIERVALTGGHIIVRREKDGSINFLELLKPAGPPPATTRTGGLPAPSPAPEVTIGELVVKDSAVDLEDHLTPNAARLSLGSLQLSLRNFTLADGASMPLHLSFDWAPKGTVGLDGAIVLKPALKADLKADVKALDLLPLSPYLEQQVNARITGGSISAESNLHASISGGQLAGSVDGDFSVHKLGLVDTAHDQDLAGFSSLAIKGLEAQTSPRLSVSIGEIGIGGPYARVRINADKSLNLASVLVPATSAPVSVPPVAAPPAPAIKIGRVDILGGEFSFSDRSVEPNVSVALTGFGGTITGLSSENLARADVALKGMVDGTGPVEIAGKLDPLGAHKFVSLKIDVTNVDLLFLGPYAEKYAGYGLARGQLLVDSKILVDGDAVDSTNVVTLNQFTFGAAHPGPDATALPVRLGVALLKDMDGKIVIDLPVKGSLDNPEFKIGKVVLRVVVNLLTKAAVSPFSLIGSMFGGGGDELAFQDFAPGSSVLRPTELPKLETLAKALANRPALSLGIEGGYDAAADTYALRRTKLEEMVRSKVWEERHVVSPNIPPPGELVITPEENAAMVKKLFDLKFPPGTQFGAPLPPPPAAAPPPAPPRPGLLRRIADIVTFKEAREQRAAQKESEQLAAQHEQELAKAAASGLPLDQMTGRLAESMEVTTDDLGALASARAQSVRNYFVAVGQISTDRLFLTQSQGQARENKGPRVLLALQ